MINADIDKDLRDAYKEVLNKVEEETVDEAKEESWDVGKLAVSATGKDFNGKIIISDRKKFEKVFEIDVAWVDKLCAAMKKAKKLTK